MGSASSSVVVDDAVVVVVDDDVDVAAVSSFSSLGSSSHVIVEAAGLYCNVHVGVLQSSRGKKYKQASKDRDNKLRTSERATVASSSERTGWKEAQGRRE